MCNKVTWKKKGETQVWDQPGLPYNFKATLDSIQRPCLIHQPKCRWVHFDLFLNQIYCYWLHIYLGFYLFVCLFEDWDALCPRMAYNSFCNIKLLAFLCLSLPKNGITSLNYQGRESHLFFNSFKTHKKLKYLLKEANKTFKVYREITPF